MGTCNFRGCGRFGYWVNVEEYDEDFYRDEYPDLTDDERYRLFEETSCEWYDYYAHGMQKALDELNSELVFHELKVENGYYEGLEIVLEPRYEPRSCQGWYAPDDRDGWDYIAIVYDAMEGACYGERADDPKFQRRCRRKFEDECDRILDWLTAHAEEWFFHPIGCVARFGNGEAWYQRSEAPAYAVEHCIGLDIGCGLGEHSRAPSDWECEHFLGPLWSTLETASGNAFTGVIE